MPPRDPPEAPSPPLPSAAAYAPDILLLHSRTRLLASSVSPHVHSSRPPFLARIPVHPYQSRNDRHINGHRYPRQQSAGDIRHQVSGILSYPRLRRSSKLIADACSLWPLT